MAQPTEPTTLEWVKTIGSILLSWPSVGFVSIFIFRQSILKLIEKFIDGTIKKSQVRAN